MRCPGSKRECSGRLERVSTMLAVMCLKHTSPRVDGASFTSAADDGRIVHHRPKKWRVRNVRSGGADHLRAQRAHRASSPERTAARDGLVGAGHWAAEQLAWRRRGARPIAPWSTSASLAASRCSGCPGSRCKTWLAIAPASYARRTPAHYRYVACRCGRQAGQPGLRQRRCGAAKNPERTSASGGLIRRDPLSDTSARSWRSRTWRLRAYG